MTDPELGERILNLRLRLGLTQRQLAERLGVHEITVCHWETGHNTPSVPHYLAICELERVEVDTR